MAGYLVYADAPQKRDASALDCFLVSAADADGARAAARALVGLTSGYDDLAAVQVSVSDLATPDVALQGGQPVGAREQSTWPTLTRGGDHIPRA